MAIKGEAIFIAIVVFVFGALLFTFIASFIEYFELWRCDTGRNPFMVLLVRPLKHTHRRAHACKTKSEKKKAQTQCKRMERSEKKVFAIYAKIKVIKWFGVCLVLLFTLYFSRPLSLISLLCVHLCLCVQCTHSSALHSFSFFFKYSFVCSWCNFCMAHCCLHAVFSFGFRVTLTRIINISNNKPIWAKI